jgi:hypothetical protein
VREWKILSGLYVQSISSLQCTNIKIKIFVWYLHRGLFVTKDNIVTHNFRAF